MLLFIFFAPVEIVPDQTFSRCFTILPILVFFFLPISFYKLKEGGGSLEKLPLYNPRVIELLYRINALLYSV